MSCVREFQCFHPYSMVSIWLHANLCIIPSFSFVFFSLPSSPIPANKPTQVILTPSKEYNPQSSATWRALQETDAPVDPEKIASYTALKEHDPIYSEVYAAPVAPKPGQRPPPRTNALPGPRSPVSDLLPTSFKAANNHVEAQSVPRSLLSPPKTGTSLVREATLAESKPVNHQMTSEPIKIPLYETNSIGGRKKIAQTASFNRLMMDVLGEWTEQVPLEQN